MLSRRHFLLSSFGLLASHGSCLPAWAGHHSGSGRSGAHSLCRQDWPPAIVPDRVVFVEKGLSCVTDQFGRLAIVDLKKEEGARVIGELRGIGRRVQDFTAPGHRAYALATRDSASGDTQFMLVAINLAPLNEPSVMSHIILGHYLEPTAVVANQELICVGGMASSGDNLVSVFRTNPGRAIEPTFLSSFSVDQPVVAMDLQDKQLVVLGAGRSTSSQVDYVNLYFPRSPQVRKTLKLDGDFRVMARLRDLLFVAGQAVDTRGLELKTIVLEPAPHAVESQTLGNFTQVLDAAVQKGRVAVLGEHDSERAVSFFSIDRSLRLTPEQVVSLPSGQATPGLTARMAMKDRLVNIALGWEGVQVLTLDKMGWRQSYTYSIPRLPASSVASWDNWAVLAGQDLKLYDIAKPEKPALILTADPLESIRCIAGAGSYVLCLSKSSLSLRKMDRLAEVIATVKLSGQQLAYDKMQQRAYVLSALERKTTVTPVKVFSNALALEKSVDLPAGWVRLSAADGHLLLGGLNDLALYRLSAGNDPLGKRHLENLAIRDLVLTSEYVVVTAVDRNSKGFLLVLSRQERDLSEIGSIELPQDGVALAIADGRVAVVGRSQDGKDTVSLVSLANPASPQVIASFPSVEAASAVTIKDHLAIVVGRGLEILTMG